MKKTAWVCFALVLLTVMNSVSAASLEMNVEPSERTVKVSEVANFEITLKNNYLNSDGFYLYLTGAPVQWVNVGTSFVKMPARSTVTVPLYFYPNDKPGRYEYAVNFQSMNNPSLMVSSQIVLNIIGEVKEADVKLVRKSIEAVDDVINIEIVLMTQEKKEFTVDYSIVSESGATVATETRTYTVEGRGLIAHQMPVSSELMAGKYTVNAVVKGTGITADYSFSVNPVHKIVKTEEETSSAFFHEVKISVSNEGNVVENGYMVSSQIPTGYVTFANQPANCGEDKCDWVIGKLNPDESMNITYRIEYWPLMAEGIMIAVLLGVFLFVGWNRSNMPSLNKGVKPAGDGYYTTILEIKNPRKKISSVVLRDVVSPLFEVSPRFETVKPTIRRSDHGTELLWNIPEIHPGEHRIFHYKVKPVVGANLRMPKAHMKYMTESGDAVSISSSEESVTTS